MDEVEMEEVQEQASRTAILQPVTVQESLEICDDLSEPDKPDILELQTESLVREDEDSETPKGEKTFMSDVIEPHEQIQQDYEQNVLDTIMSRVSHGFDIEQHAVEIPMHPGFRIGQIEYAEEYESDKKSIAEGYDAMADHPTATRTVSSESSSDTMTASSVTASFMAAQASLEVSSEKYVEIQPIAVDSTAVETVYTEESSEKCLEAQDEPEGEDVIDPFQHEPTLEVVNIDTQQSEREQGVILMATEGSIDRTESASLDSEDLEEPYGDQKEEMVQEMQVEITPSPQPPPHEAPLSEDEEDLDDHDSRDTNVDETARQRPPERGDLELLKQVGSLSSEERIKTSSSSDTSVEPTLLAATYDLDSGSISRVVATYDISPDTVEKTLTVESQPKAIMSSPEDEVFEGGEGTESKGETEEEITERETSPFEMVGEDDISGYDDYVESQKKVEEHEDEPQEGATAAAVGVAVIAGSATVIAGVSSLPIADQPQTTDFDRSPSFDHSSPISSSEPSDLRGPISPLDASPAVEALPVDDQAEPLVESEIIVDEEDIEEAPGEQETLIYTCQWTDRS